MQRFFFQITLLHDPFCEISVEIRGKLMEISPVAIPAAGDMRETMMHRMTPVADVLMPLSCVPVTQDVLL